MENKKYLRYIKRLEKKKKIFLYNHFTKYIIDYKIEGNNIRILSNIGTSRVVKNTKENQRKLNRIIVESKVKIASKIDEYGNASTERLLVLLINITFLGISGMLVPLTFFIGNYILFLLSIFLFSFSTISTSIITFDYYILLKEIKNLKQITGYKKDMEINLSLPNLKSFKTR
ncbi:MAG: hypothetical protein J1F35_00310 [Erysipelotrichales bacterium]|nr:hypothetical protein [Erysipelotrichales bacterium]